MAITTTTNKSLIKVTVGTEAGTWGPYINTDQDLLDNMLGGTATIALTNAPVILSSAQYQCAFIRFTGAITANIAVTFPSVGSFYSIINDTTNSSAFGLTAQTTAAGGRIIGIPPGSMTEILTDGVNARFRGLPPVGTYWDYGGSSVPAWVVACTIPPYLNCDGTAFSSVTYPNLANALGGTTLPDARGGTRFALNQGTGRLSGAIDGNAFLNRGGNSNIALGQINMPNYSLTVNDPGHHHQYVKVTSVGGVTGGAGTNQYSVSTQDTSTETTGITVDSGGSGTMFPVLNPGYVGGITMIRAA